MYEFKNIVFDGFYLHDFYFQVMRQTYNYFIIIKITDSFFLRHIFFDFSHIAFFR